MIAMCFFLKESISSIRCNNTIAKPVTSMVKMGKAPTTGRPGNIPNKLQWYCPGGGY